MSLTLRDAQHLSWKTFKKFEALNEKRSENFGTAAELANKAGDIVNKIKVLRNSTTLEGKEDLGKLLSELLFAALIVAEANGISLEESFLQTVDEIILGFVS